MTADDDSKPDDRSIDRSEEITGLKRREVLHGFAKYTARAMLALLMSQGVGRPAAALSVAD
jgi:hypothetical protein